MSVGSWELPGLQVLFSWIVFSFRVQVHLCICNTYQHLVMHSEQGGNYQVIHPFTKSHEFAKSVVQMKRAEEIRPLRFPCLAPDGGSAAKARASAPGCALDTSPRALPSRELSERLSLIPSSDVRLLIHLFVSATRSNVCY